MMSALAMSTSAKLLVKRMTSINLRLIGVSRRKAAISGLEIGDAQQLRTDVKSCGAKDRWIDFQSNTAVVGLQRNHSATMDKIFRLSHGDNGLLFHRRQDLTQTSSLGLANEQQMT